MRARTSARILTIVLMSACGRTENDHDASGGAPSSGGVVGLGGVIGDPGGTPGLSGAPGQGGALGSGGKVGAGGNGRGGSGHGGSGHGGGPGGSAGAGGAEEGVLFESSWDTVMAVTITRSDRSNLLKCSKAAFTMHLTPNTPNGGYLDVIWGTNGTVLDGTLLQETFGSPHYVYAPNLSIPTGGGDCSVTSATVDALRLDGEDQDGDGVVDHVTGTGTAVASVFQGDVVESVGIGLTLNATPDRTRPTLVAPTTTVHPLDGVTLRASEPLARSTQLFLNNGTSQVPLKDTNVEGAALGWASSPFIPPFQTAWTVSGMGTDLGGLAIDFTSTPVVQVLADPGLFAQDGFESPPKMAITGDVKLVSGIGTLPPIAGAQSLLVPPNTSATFHLARPAATSVVRLSLQRLTSVNYMSGSAAPIEAGIIGGTFHVTGPLGAVMGTPTATGDATWSYATPKEEIKIELTESGPEVVVRVAPYGCNGLCPPPQALLIDDLRIE